jgi:Leucine-rich repeat (LRR) protein
LEDAVAAYEEISESGPNGGSFSKLEGAVVIWENELAELDTENKKARINVKIAKGLYENLANAYSYLYSGDQAVEAAKKGVKLYGNFSTPRSQALEARMNVLQVRQIAAEKNSGIISNPERLAELGELAGKSDVAVHQMPGTEMARLESEYSSFVTMHAMARHEAEQQKYDEAVASGEVNPYEKYITETTTQGKMIMMTPFTMAPELTELPAELCSISDLSQIMITGNKIATIPSDISNLGQLKKLDLSNNQIENIPPEIGMLTSLKTLNLSGNPISSIPDEIKNCTSLKTLNLKNTNLPGNEQERISELLADTKIKF